MEVTNKPHNVPYRIIVRDETTQASKSFGVYNKDFDLLTLYDIVKDFMQRVEAGEEVEVVDLENKELVETEEVEPHGV